MKEAIIVGIIVLVLSALFIWAEIGNFWQSGLSGNLPSLEELSIPLIAGSLGVFAGIGLIVIGFWKRQK